MRPSLVAPAAIVLSIAGVFIRGTQAQTIVPLSAFDIAENRPNPFYYAITDGPTEPFYFSSDRPGLVQGVILDCLPLLQRFPGGSIQWYVNTRDAAQMLTGYVIATPMNQNITGVFNNLLIIESTTLTTSADSGTSGLYTCEVCIDRSSPLEKCVNGTTDVFVLGSPPNPDVSIGSLIAGGLSCLVTDENGTIIAARPADGSADITGFTTSGQFDVSCSDTNVPPVVDTTNFTREGQMLQDPPFRIAGTNAFRVFSTDPVNIRDVAGEYICTMENRWGARMDTGLIIDCGITPELTTKPDSDIPLTSEDGDVVLVGCGSCVDPGESISLDCTPLGSTEPNSFAYNWTATIENVTVTDFPNSHMISVSEPGSYTCVVENLSGTGSAEATSVFGFKSGVNFNAKLNMQSGSVLGCDRLSSPPASVEVCAFLGETLEFDCQGINVQENETVGLTKDGVAQPFNLSVSNVDRNTTGNYSCSVSNTVCGDATESIFVQVYDPAAIDVTVDLGTTLVGTQRLGAGRTFGYVEVLEDTVELYCPATGIPDPQTNWYVLQPGPSRGRAMRELVGNIDGKYVLGNEVLNGVMTRTLQILSFSDEDLGTYVCGTSNIAGSDSGYVALRNVETFSWEEGEWSACDPPCRLGNRKRTVLCRSDFDGSIQPDFICTESKPIATQSCGRVDPRACYFTPEWRPMEYGPCPRSCGGHRERRVMCVIPRTGEIVDDSRCNPDFKPGRFEVCEDKCCKTDAYDFCQRVGTSLCNVINYQRMCCWTCGLHFIP